MRFIICCLPLLLLACNTLAQNGFKDLGIGAEVIESRGVVATVDDHGNSVVIAQATGFALVTDVDTGETVQVPTPPGMPRSSAYGSVLAANRKHYMGHGNHIVEFDPTSRTWTYDEVGSTEDGAYIGVTEGPEGTIWAGGYPHAHLVSFDYNTREIIDHGQMDPAEQYIRYIAADDAGWIYMGIGTARSNIVAYNPTTKERRQLVSEDDRVTGYAFVRACDDGRVYGSNNRQWYRLYEGNAEPIAAEEAGKAKDVGAIYWNNIKYNLPDGRQITGYHLPDRYFEIYDPATKETRTITFDYSTSGANISSVGAGPDGNVYAATNHPMRLIRYDRQAEGLTDLGHVPQIGGGNFGAITSVGNLIIGVQYADGRLWAYDVTKPWNPTQTPKVQGLAAKELVNIGICTDGQLSYLAAPDTALLYGDDFGAECSFALTAPESGQYYLHIQPAHSPQYCAVQFTFDGEEIGQPYDATANGSDESGLLLFGPLEIDDGEHILTMKTLPTEGRQPQAALVAVELGKEKRDQLIDGDLLNPVILAEWKRDITRPRAVLLHPDGKHLLMAGFAAYGLAGGGIGIYNVETGQERLLTADEDLLASHSCITLKALPNGNLIGGTSIEAPGGGHSTATEAELFIIDWPTKMLIFHTVPVPGDSDIVTIEVGEDGLVYGLSRNCTFFVFDPSSQRVIHSERWTDYGNVPRHAFQRAPDGTLYVMMSKAILRLNPGSFTHQKLADSPTGISTGGALVDGELVFASGSRVWSYQVPDLQ